MQASAFLQVSAVRNSVDLVSAAKGGDLEAFNQLVLAYQDAIYNLAYRILGDSDSAEDITQHTFITAYKNLHRFRDGSFKAWLFRIAANASKDEFVSRKRCPISLREFEDEGEENTDGRWLTMDKLPRSGFSTEEAYDLRQLEKMIQGSLNQLDLDQRLVLTLIDVLEMAYAEAAQVLGIPAGTVKSRISRGRLRLRRLLEKQLIVPAFQRKGNTPHG